jgi:hypothetical protein
MYFESKSRIIKDKNGCSENKSTYVTNIFSALRRISGFIEAVMMTTVFAAVAIHSRDRRALL